MIRGITVLCILPLLLVGTALAAEQKIPEDFVIVEGGTFIMGSPESESWREKDEDQHEATVGSFYLAKYEVTQRKYREVMNGNPSYFKGDDLPVEGLTWFDAVRFCNALSQEEGLTLAYAIDDEKVVWNRAANGYRLPTEAEWEYACRAGTTTPFNVGTSVSSEQANYYGTHPYMIENYYRSREKLETLPGVYNEKTIRVGSFAPNSWGLYDMHGNVGEWCWDWYGAYTSESQTDPMGVPSGTFRVNRGGGWNDFGKHLRSAYRAAHPPVNGIFNLGFRLARNAQ
jgi:formylglycine-generating enzyme required for sulfatase activity